MRATKASFKLGIAFENWGGQGDRYIHSFGNIGRSTWMGDFQHFWLPAQAGIRRRPRRILLRAAGGAAPASSRRPKHVKINYAYHLDAGLYARFLRKLSEPRACGGSKARSTSVEQHPESGFVEALVLESGETSRATCSSTAPAFAAC